MNKFVEIFKHCQALFRLPVQLENLGLLLEAQNSQATVLRENGQAAARAAANAKFARLTDQIAAVDSVVKELVQKNFAANEMNAKAIAAISDRFAAVQTRVDDMHANVSHISGTLAAVQTTVAELHGNVSHSSAPVASVADIRSGALLSAGYVARAVSQYESQDNSLRAATSEPIDQATDRLQQLSPDIFPYWHRLYLNAIQAYSENIEASASVWGHKYAQLFGAYVSLFARGRVLDIGCGINGKPAYLASIPNEQLAGLEPLPQKSDPGFACVQGFNEFLPWEDAGFETVVSGTSLDHVLSIEKSLEEVVRVLVPGGRYLVWLASIPGSPKYNPASAEFEPRDQYHLFHFDRAWIEPIFANHFIFEDVTIIPQPGFDHVFYCLTTKRL